MQEWKQVTFDDIPGRCDRNVVVSLKLNRRQPETAVSGSGPTHVADGFILLRSSAPWHFRASRCCVGFACLQCMDATMPSVHVPYCALQIVSRLARQLKLTAFTTDVSLTPHPSLELCCCCCCWRGMQSILDLCCLHTAAQRVVYRRGLLFRPKLNQSLPTPLHACWLDFRFGAAVTWPQLTDTDGTQVLNKHPTAGMVSSQPALSAACSVCARC
jgi:hypothetical protein